VLRSREGTLYRYGQNKAVPIMLSYKATVLHAMDLHKYIDKLIMNLFYFIMLQFCNSHEVGKAF
jgi:hypothetical protein